MSKVKRFVEQNLCWLDLEKQEDICQTKLRREQASLKELQQQGVCVLKLLISSRHTGLFGRIILTFESGRQIKELPSHSITVGDIVGLAESNSTNKDSIATGTVCKTTSQSISVVFDDSFDGLDLDSNTQYHLLKLSNDVTYRRLKQALQEIDKFRNGPCAQLLSILFEESEPSCPLPYSDDGFKFFNLGLDESQRQAVIFALHQRELAIIHGPPGTGKTTTIVEVIQQAAAKGLKVLACAPSNVAVDNLVERLARVKLKIVRLGHPARAHPDVQKFSLDGLVAVSSEAEITSDVRKDIEKTQARLRTTQEKGEKFKLRNELKTLRQELRKRDENATRTVLSNAQVILSTLTSATNEGPLHLLEENHFDLAIIDECSQALEVACWIALLKVPRCILAGDHLQLPPTILCNQAAAEGFAVTLLERLVKAYGDQVTRMLTMQYRMHEFIMKWPSQQLYDGRLVAHESVAHHLLKDLPGIIENDVTLVPLLLIDTAGCDLHELDLPDEQSKGNEGEADLVSYHVKRLIESGLAAQDIAVIAPYNLQVELLRLRLASSYPTLEIKSVDGFQGREKEAVILSLVRSNDKGEVGFLAEDRRINVAITRARRHLALVCNTETVSRHSFLKSLVDYMTEMGEIHSAQEYIQSGAVQLTQLVSDRINKIYRAEKTKAEKVKNIKKHAQNVSQGYNTNNCSQQTLQDKSSETSADNDWLSEITEVVQQFALDVKQQVYAFPASLNSRQRMLLHEVAEHFNLHHESVGEGNERHMVIKKRDLKINEQLPTTITNGKKDHKSNDVMHKNVSINTKNLPNNQSHVPSDNSESVSRTVNKTSAVLQEVCLEDAGQQSIGSTNSDSLSSQCSFCSKLIPLQNMLVHSARCSKVDAIKNAAAAAIEAGDCSATDAGVKKKKKQQSKVEVSNVKEPFAEAGSDFDAVIASAIRENWTCSYVKCKASVRTLGQNCEYCSKRYCLSHHIPEVHGCGDRAKIRARQVISERGILYAGSGVPVAKASDGIKRKQLEKKLHNKLDKLSEDRQRSKKKSS